MILFVLRCFDAYGCSFSAGFRAGSKVLIGMTHHQVEAPHGLKNNILMGPLEGTGIAIKDQVIGTEVRMLENICAITEYMTNDIMYLVLLALLIGGCISLGSHPT